jgi:hypothetical protein
MLRKKFNTLVTQKSTTFSRLAESRIRDMIVRIEKF